MDGDDLTNVSISLLSGYRRQFTDLQTAGAHWEVAKAQTFSEF